MGILWNKRRKASSNHPTTLDVVFFLFVIMVTVSLMRCVIYFPIPINQVIDKDNDKVDAKLKEMNQEVKSSYINVMPKGADLHVHLSGTVKYDELLHMSLCDKKRTWCLDKLFYASERSINFTCPTYDIKKIATCKGKVLDLKLHNQLTRSWSMINYIKNHSVSESFKHFFSIFDKVKSMTRIYQSSILSNLRKTASEQKLLHLEVLIRFNSEIAEVEKCLRYSNSLTYNDIKAMMKKCQKIVNKVAFNSIKYYENLIMKSNEELKCNRNNNDNSKRMNKRKFSFNSIISPCSINIKFIISHYRHVAPSLLFVQLPISFAMIKLNSVIIGVNLVGPEDTYSSLRYFNEQMKIFKYISFYYKTQERIHRSYISLHAGEILPVILINSNYSFHNNHIYNSVNIGNAERIGHGIDVYYENKHLNLTQLLRRRNIVIEVLFSSNLYTFHINKNHPFLYYVKNNISIVLSTDDPGITRTTISDEYLTLLNNYNISYFIMKSIIRNSLEYSFLPGRSLFSRYRPYSIPVLIKYCENIINPFSVTPSCKEYLKQNTKAKLQFELEAQLYYWERNIINYNHNHK